MSLLEIAGGILGQKESRRNRRQAQHQFDQQMDFTVQRRVKDAMAAGVHPLFALGASSGASPTAHVSGNSGSALGKALANTGKSFAMRKLQQAEIRRAEAGATRDEAEAAFINSERARLEQNMGARGHDGGAINSDVKTFGVPTEDIAFGPGEYFNPEVPVSSSTGVRAGVQPKYIEYMRPDGRKMRMLNPELNMDEVSQFDFMRRELNLHITDQLEGLANWIRAKRNSPSNREVERLQRKADAIKNNPHRVREYQALERAIKAKLKELYQRWKS